MTSKVLLMASLVMLGASQLKAQLNVGSSGAPDASAILQISSTTKGLRLPNVALSTTTTFSLTTATSAAAAVGMTVYNTTAGITSSNAAYPATGVGAYTWDGTGWLASKSAAANNIYTNDGTLLAARTVTQAAFPLTFSGTGGVILNSGNVGIGTLVPVFPLSLRGTGATTNIVAFHSSTDDVPYVGMGYDQTNDALVVRTNVGTSTFNGTAMTVQRTTGNVGIGATAPSQKLQVIGNIKAGLDNAGSVLMAPGSATTAGNLSFYKGDGITRLGYIGNNNTNLNYTTENGARHQFVNFDNADTVARFLANNLTAGVEIGYTTIRETGSSSNINMAVTAKGTGLLSLQSEATGGINLYPGGTGGILALNSGNTASNPRFYTGDTLEFQSASNPYQLALLPSGNVGIGTNSPTQTLDVNGTTRLRGNATGTTSDYMLTINPTTGLVNQILGSAYIGGVTGFWNLNAGNIYNNNGAKVGIGTSTPLTDLNIQQTGSGKGISLTGASVDGFSDPSGMSFVLGHNSTGNRQLWSGDLAGVGLSHSSFTRTVISGDPASTTTNQIALLDAVSGDGLTRRPISIGFIDPSGGVMLGGGAFATAPASFVWNGSNMAIGSGYHGAAAPANGLLVQGSVGIGTTSPTSPLSILGNANGNTGGIVVSTGTVTSGSIYNGTANVNATEMSSEFFSGQRAGTILHAAHPSGTTNASDYISFFLAGTQIGGVSQATSASIAFNTTSDIRLKENIRPTTFGLGDVMKIQVRDYNYKADKNIPQTGFIAQQLYTVFPVAVTVGGEDAKTKPWQVDYSKLTPLLTKAIQEQQAEILELKAIVEELRKKLK